MDSTGYEDRERQRRRDLVARIWEETTGHSLSPARRAEFDSREHAAQLRRQPEDRLRKAARRTVEAHLEGHLY
ncbi:MAG TPA: hypothetical protein VFJ19_05310, partial [Nocardioidaceae bacterium]|nr:hypothetical protein [Nocardioidaceae bacterium]